MKRKLLVTFVLLAAALLARAQGSESVTMLFSQTPRDPVALGMAGTDAALKARQVFAMPQVEGSVSYQAWQPKSLLGTKNLAARVAYRLKDGLSVRLSFAQDSGEAFDIADRYADAISSFKPYGRKIGAGVSLRLSDLFGVSADLHYLDNALAPGAEYSAFAGDVLFCGRYAGVRAAAGVTSVGTKVTSGDRSFPLPAAAVIAMGYAEALNDSFAIDFSVEGDFYFYGSYRVAAGLESAFSDLVFVRLGYNFGGYDSILPSFASLGLGLKVAGCRLDAAYLAGSAPMGGTFQVGLGYAF